MANTYSFLDFHASFTGPTGSFDIGSEAATAEEGVSISFMDDKATLTMGAGSDGMHSLHAGKAGTVTVRLLKTSPVNALLSAAYNAQTASSIVYGQNTINLRNVATGDNIIARQCGFRKHPDINYQKDGGTMEWVFNAIKIDVILGDGNPESQYAPA